MTSKSRFFKWLKANNKLDVYSSMIEVYYNQFSILDNKMSAQAGILEIEKRYVNSRFGIAGQIARAKKEDNELEEN